MTIDFSVFLKQMWYVWVIAIILVVYQIFKPQIRGLFGEKSVAFLLSFLNKKKYKVLHNVLLKTSTGTVQIDHIVVSNYGIFVIETKNYSGVIFGKEDEEYWTQVLGKNKFKLYNPIRQNYGHVMALKEVLSRFGDLKIIPIVVFTTRANLKLETKTEVTYTVKLLSTIKKYREECISDEIKELVFLWLQGLNESSVKNMMEHVKSVKAKKEGKTYENR